MINIPKADLLASLAEIQAQADGLSRRIDDLVYLVEITDDVIMPVLPEPPVNGKLVYSWDFSSGLPTGYLYFLAQNAGSIAAVNDPAGLPGRVAALKIEKKTLNSNASYLFFTRAIMPEHSITRWKVYIPQPTASSWQWFNIWQSKVASTAGGNTYALWNIGVMPDQIVVGYKPETNSTNRTYTGKPMPFDRWVDVEVEYKQDFQAGIMAVKIDGDEIFRCTDKPTSETIRPDISASIMNYSADYYSTVYVKAVELYKVE